MTIPTSPQPENRSSTSETTPSRGQFYASLHGERLKKADLYKSSINFGQKTSKFYDEKTSNDFKKHSQSPERGRTSPAKELTATEMRQFLLASSLPFAQSNHKLPSRDETTQAQFKPYDLSTFSGKQKAVIDPFESTLSKQAKGKFETTSTSQDSYVPHKAKREAQSMDSKLLQISHLHMGVGHTNYCSTSAAAYTPQERVQLDKHNNKEELMKSHIPFSRTGESTWKSVTKESFTETAVAGERVERVSKSMNVTSTLPRQAKLEAVTESRGSYKDPFSFAL
jgi:hypothetical protein